MINIAICDDEKNELLKLVDIIKTYEKENMEQHNICYTVFENGTDLIASIERGIRYHIILLDIIMPLENGIEIAKEIRCFDSLTKIIFITSSSEFAVESYGVDAFHYLLKPALKEKLTAIFGKAISSIFDTPEKSILVDAKSGLSKIYLHYIKFVEINGRQLSYHLKSGQILETAGTLGELEKSLLSHKQFIKPHRSYIINMDYIDTITTKEIQMQSHISIPISRINYSDIKKVYLDYSFGRGVN